MMRRLSGILIFLGVMLLAAAYRLDEIQPAGTPQTAASYSVTTATTSAASTSSSTAQEAVLLPYSVVRVVDGDTVVVWKAEKTLTVRVIGLDTPEVVDPRKPVQCFGIEASDHAKELLNGKSVRLEMDPSQDELDKYGRTLAYIFMSDGTNFAERMIAEGFAHEYTYRLPYKYQDSFKAAERRAREEKLGLWADEKCAAESARS